MFASLSLYLTTNVRVLVIVGFDANLGGNSTTIIQGHLVQTWEEYSSQFTTAEGDLKPSKEHN